jgi:hypothetical protein
MYENNAGRAGRVNATEIAPPLGGNERGAFST